MCRFVDPSTWAVCMPTVGRNLVCLDCVARVDASMSMRACASTSHHQSNLSCVGDRPHTCFDKSCPPSSHAANPNMHSSATVVLVPGMAMIFVTHFILELASDVSSCTTK